MIQNIKVQNIQKQRLKHSKDSAIDKIPKKLCVQKIIKKIVKKECQEKDRQNIVQIMLEKFESYAVGLQTANEGEI